MAPAPAVGKVFLLLFVHKKKRFLVCAYAISEERRAAGDAHLVAWPFRVTSSIALPA
jgi:hypothetical protein